MSFQPKGGCHSHDRDIRWTMEMLIKKINKRQAGQGRRRLDGGQVDLMPPTQSSGSTSAAQWSLAAVGIKTWAGRGPLGRSGSPRPAGSVLGRTWWWAPRRCVSRWSGSPGGSWSAQAGSQPARRSSRQRPAGERHSRTASRWVGRRGWSKAPWCNPGPRWPPRCSGWGAVSSGGIPGDGWAPPPGTRTRTSTGNKANNRVFMSWYTFI